LTENKDVLMLKLYFAPNTRAVRVAWLLEELGLDYDVVSFALGDKEMREAPFLKVHPNGRMPVLVDGDVSIFESGAIVEYLLARHAQGRMRPATDSTDFPAYLQWLHYCEGMMMPPVNTIMVETVILPPDRRNEVNVKRALKLLGQMLGTVETHMEGRDFLAGDFSGADIMLGHSVTAISQFGDHLDAFPNLRAYSDRLTTRPAFQKAHTL
jgi:glutathione S-transferase